jgi:hypothetical protein
MRHFDQFRYLPIKVTRDGWGRESHLLADCQNRGNLRCNLYVVFSNPREAVAVRVGLFPNWPTRLHLPLSACGGNQLFLTRTPGRFKTQVIGANLALEEIELIEFGYPPDAEGWIDVDNARVAPNPPADFTFPAEPLVDELHQWESRDWPGKANSIAEVAEALQIQLCARQIRAARLNLRYLLSQDPPASEFHECAPSG